MQMLLQQCPGIRSGSGLSHLSRPVFALLMGRLSFVTGFYLLLLMGFWKKPTTGFWTAICLIAAQLTAGFQLKRSIGSKALLTFCTNSRISRPPDLIFFLGCFCTVDFTQKDLFPIELNQSSIFYCLVSENCKYLCKLNLANSSDSDVFAVMTKRLDCIRLTVAKLITDWWK